jgi:plastocyanin
MFSSEYTHAFKARILFGMKWTALFLAVIFTACAAPAPPEPTPIPTPTPTPGPVGAEVSMQNLAFIPNVVTIKQGQSVRWTNTETAAVDHTVTSGRPEDTNPGSLFDSGLISKGQTYTFTFNTPGTYIYYCRLHFTMGMRDAQVIVTPGP